MQKFIYLLLFISICYSRSFAQVNCSGTCGSFTSTAATVCKGASLTFTTGYTSGVTWSVTPNLTISSSSNGSITVVGASAGSGYICMSYNSGGTICSACKPITINASSAPGASISNFVPAPDLSYVKINALPASSSLYYTWYINDVQYGSEMLGGMQLAYPANCSQIYQVYVKVRSAGTCGGSSTSGCRKFTLDCSTGKVTDLGSCTGGGTPGDPVIISKSDVSNIVADAKVDDLKIIPNPAVNGQAKVMITGSVSGDRLYVYDINGKQVYTTTAGPEVQLNLQQLPKGIYVVKYKHFAEKLLVQ